MVTVACDQICQVTVSLCKAVFIEHCGLLVDQLVRYLVVGVEFSEADGAEGERLLIGFSDEVGAVH